MSHSGAWAADKRKLAKEHHITAPDATTGSEIHTERTAPDPSPVLVVVPFMGSAASVGVRLRF